MVFIVYLVCALVAAYSFLSWVAPLLIAAFIGRKLRASIKIKRFGPFYCTLYDVEYMSDGIKLHIDEIGVHSSFINSDVSKLITLAVKNVRIHTASGDAQCHSSKQVVDFREKSMPRFVPMVAPFMAVHVYNVSAFTRPPHTTSPYVVANAKELHIDGSIVHNCQTLLANVNVFDAHLKLLSDINGIERTLCEVMFTITVEATLVAHGPLAFQKLAIGIWSVQSVVASRQLYDLLAEHRRVGKQSAAVVDADVADFWRRWQPIIPTISCALRIGEISVCGVRDNGHSDFISTLSNLSVNYGCYGSQQRQMLASLVFGEWTVRNNKEQLLLIKRVKMDAKMINTVIDAHVLIDAFLLTYEHDIIFHWLRQHFNATTRLDCCSDEAVDQSSNTMMDAIQRTLKTYNVNIRVKVINASALMKFANANGSGKQLISSVGMDVLKCVLNFSQPSTCECDLFVVENVWWSLNDCCNNRQASSKKRMHFWGTPLYLGKIAVHSSQHTQCAIESIQIEWSPTAVEHLEEAVKASHQYCAMFGAVRRGSAERPKHFQQPFAITSHLQQVNFFFATASSNEYLIVRFDSLRVERASDDGIAIDVDECKALLRSHTATSTHYNCVPAAEIREHKLYVQHASACRSESRSAWRLQFATKAVLRWSVNLHLKLLYLARDITDFYGQHLAAAAATQTTERVAQRATRVEVSAMGDFSVDVHISEAHVATIAVSEFNASLATGAAVDAIGVARLTLMLDGDTICEVSQLLYRPVDDAKTMATIESERREMDTFNEMVNRAFSLSIDSLRIAFPYEHRYAEAVHEELATLVKWLKRVHNAGVEPPSLQRAAASPPSDHLISIKSFSWAMADDPFEVKLRDNFELLVDEYSESIKRRNKLADKVEELLKKHLHLPAGKVDELYANLQAKNAQIYIQRSKQLQRECGQQAGGICRRRCLFTWSMLNVEITVLADSSISGDANVLKIMKEIDADSPWPEEAAPSFATLWCRMVSLRSEEWRFQLRDFPQPLLLISHWYICGLLVGAEQLALGRAQRDVVVDLGDPFQSAHVARGLLPLKFYHDFTCEIRSFSYAFGPCWEPVIAQCNLSTEKVVSPSKDPSPPLPFWDKMRLLLHGRVTAEVQQMTVLLHASLDPYNTTEEMELTWEAVLMDWTDGRFVFKGDLNIFVRTASKYDDCQLLRLPNVKLIIGVEWVCVGDAKDHHGVVLCAPDKVPEYSSNHLHDSFRAFRSQHCNLAITLETKGATGGSGSGAQPAILLLYGSTLRWFESLKLILQGVTRPTRRGRIFRYVRARKLQLSRHYRSINFVLSLHKFQVCYWMSFAMQRGCELLGGHLTCTSQHVLALRPIDDGLVHRPRAEWSIVFVTSELMDSEIWLKCALSANAVDNDGDDDSDDAQEGMASYRQPVEKCYCLSVAKVSYLREPRKNYEQSSKQTEPIQQQQQQQQQDSKLPTHRLVVYDLKGAWTMSNRNVVFALFDTFTKNQQMKKNLSIDALKTSRKDGRSAALREQMNVAAVPSTSIVSAAVDESAATGEDHAAEDGDGTPPINMLQQLISEVDNKNVVFSDDLSSATRQQHLQGYQACQTDDVLHRNWNIILINAQVLLKGCETKGYVIMSAAKAEIVQRIHRPVWKECTTLVSKTTWVGALECMQYYATVNAKENDIINENIMWLTVDNIQEKEFSTITQIPEVPNMVGCGVSVGAVVSDTVGASSSDPNIDQPIQLQRIVSRCTCEFFYVGYGYDSSSVVDDVRSMLAGEPRLPPPTQPHYDDFEPLFSNARRPSPVNAFTLMHHDLDVCTNSLQYAMLLDIINNLLLHVDTHKKEALERLARMRFQLQLLQNHQSVDEQRKPIHMLQTRVRASLTRLRRLEKDTYLLHKVLADGVEDEDDDDDVAGGGGGSNGVDNDAQVRAEIAALERSVHECKNMLNMQAEELDMMLSCYKDSQLLATSRMSRARNHIIRVVRANEIHFKHAQWRLTETDGQIGIADLVLTNFLYTKNSKSDDSVEHLLELGYVRMTNLLPNQVYKEVLLPTEIQSNMPVEHKRVVRIFCREKPPVGGISVKEHFEINVVPLTVGLTKKFYDTMLKFCFPERSSASDPDLTAAAATDDDSETLMLAPDAQGGGGAGARRKTAAVNSGTISKRLNRDSNFYVTIADDVEKMKQRAEKNKLFIYIKIPEVPVRLSYKGNKEKNLEDIRDFSLIIPTLEYHNVTWTWLDLLLAVRSDSRKVILSQAIKQKLQFKRNIGSSTHDESAPHEEDDDKARMLLGMLHGIKKRSANNGAGGVFKTFANNFKKV